MKIFSIECNPKNIETCTNINGGNSCKKIDGIDTCVCGSERECDPASKNPMCVNGNGDKNVDDLKATCRYGK